MKPDIKGIIHGEKPGTYYLSVGRGLTTLECQAHIFTENEARRILPECLWDRFKPISEKETTMYTPGKGKKFWIVWNLRSNDQQTWLAKEDCPSVLHATQEDAEKEAARLSNKTGGKFVILEAIETITNPPRYQVETLR